MNSSFSLAKNTLQDKETVQLYPRMKMWTVQIRDQTARSVQSDLDLRCPQQLFLSSPVRIELKAKAPNDTFASKWGFVCFLWKLDRDQIAPYKQSDVRSSLILS